MTSMNSQNNPFSQVDNLKNLEHNPYKNGYMTFPEGLMYCPKCQQVRSGNYCTQCGTKLVLSKDCQIEETCPCCGGSGKIRRYGPMWYNWQLFESRQPKAMLNSEGVVGQC